MINYGRTQSTERPDPVEIRDTMVFVASNITEIFVPMEDGVMVQYEFDLVGYDKNEYLKMMIDAEADMNAQLLDAQLALCELYEMMTEGDDLV
jgi:hypothetical protein